MPLEKSILSAFSTTLNDHSVEWTDEQIIEYPVCCALLEISSDLICAMDDGRSWPYLFRYDEIYEKYYSEYGVPSKNKLLSLRHGLLQILSAKQLIEYSAYFTVDEIRALFDAIDRQCVASRNEACNLSHVGLGLITLKNSTLWTRKNWTALLTKAGQCDCSLEFESDLRNLLNWEILTQGHFDYVMNSTGSRANVRLLLENFYQRFILLLSIPMLEIDSSGYMNQLQGALDRFNQAQIKSDDSVLQFHFHRLVLLLCKERSLACLQTIPMIKLKTFLAEDQHTALRARLGIWESHKTPLEDITYYLQNVLLEANTRSLVHGSSMVIPRLSMVSSLFQPENEEEDENDEEMVPPLLVRKSS